MPKPNTFPRAALYWGSQMSTMAFEVALCVILGNVVDQRWGTSPAFVLIGSVCGMIVASYHLWQLVRRFQTPDEKDSQPQ